MCTWDDDDDDDDVIVVGIDMLNSAHTEVSIVLCMLPSVRKPTQVGCSGMWCFRMWGLKKLALNPSPMSAFGVKSPHLQLLRVNRL